MSHYYNYDGLAPVDLTPVRCFVCGADDHRPVAIDNGYQIVRCNQCDLVYVHPRPNPAQLKAFYEKYYDPDAEVPEVWEREMGAVFREHARWMHAHHGKPGTVLDVGSSFGHMLRELEQLGWDTVGIEPSAIAAAHSRKILKGTVHTALFEDVALPDASFDAIVSLYVCEHVYDPRAFMVKIHRLLKPGGIAIVRIPFTRPLFPVMKLLGRTLMFAPMHLNDFPPPAMRRLGKDLGFERVEFRIGPPRKASDFLEKAGAIVLGGVGRAVEKASGGERVFPFCGALSYLMYKPRAAAATRAP